MERRSPWLMLASGLWTLTIGLGIYVSGDRSSLATAMWAVVCGQAACTVTALVFFDCAIARGLARERLRVEQIATIAAQETARSVGVVQPIKR